MLIKRKENNPTLTFGIYRKPTNSGRHLDFNSYHHQRHKKNVVAALRHRANKICSPDEMKKENDTIFKELVQNGYPRKLVKTTIPEPTRENPETPRQYVETPYIKGASERVGKLLKNHNIVLSNKSTNSLRNQLCNLKDKWAKEEI